MNTLPYPTYPGSLSLDELQVLGGQKPLTRPARAPSFLVGLDLGQAQDYSAWTIAEMREPQGEPASYDVVHLERVRGVTYPAIVDHTRTLISALKDRQSAPRIDLIVDFTGVGRAVADLLADARLGAHLTLVTITGGDAVTTGERGEKRVPKRDLAGVVQVCLQAKRLRIAAELAHAKTLQDELVNFRVKVSLAGHDSYGAGAEWREGNHDDLVLALALALWHGENRVTPMIYVVDF